MKTLFYLSLLLVLFSCGGTDATTDDADQTMAEREADTQATQAIKENTETMDFLSTTVAAVQKAGGDITALSPEAAANNVNGWISKLSDVEGAEPIVEDLANLKKEFLLGSEDGLDGPAIGLILNRLADNTRAVSDQAKGLDMLANVLEKGAETLTSY